MAIKSTASATVTDILTLFFVGAIIVLIVTHPAGFAQSAGTVFSGINTLGGTLTGVNIDKARR